MILAPQDCCEHATLHTGFGIIESQFPFSHLLSPELSSSGTKPDANMVITTKYALINGSSFQKRHHLGDAGGTHISPILKVRSEPGTPRA